MDVLIGSLIEGKRIGNPENPSKNDGRGVDAQDAATILVASMCQTTGIDPLLETKTLLDMKPKDRPFEGAVRFGTAFLNIIHGSTESQIKMVTIFPKLGCTQIIFESSVSGKMKTDAINYEIPQYSESDRFGAVRVHFDIYPKLLATIRTMLND